MTGWSIEPMHDLSARVVAALVEAAAAEGVRNMALLVTRWEDGSERFNRPGEQLLAARGNGREWIGVGGVSWCPDVPGALRVRRFYVHPSWRRHGVARALATWLMDHAAAHTDTITCNALASAAAPPFWEAMGFVPTDCPGITHVRHLPR